MPIASYYKNISRQHCGCGTNAVAHKDGSPVCQHCLDIETRMKKLRVEKELRTKHEEQLQRSRTELEWENRMLTRTEIGFGSLAYLDTLLRRAADNFKSASSAATGSHVGGAAV